MTATPCLIGRSSSHFTRVPRMLALELGIDCGFQPVYDLGSRHTTDYGGNPAMKLPVLRLSDGQVAFGAENVARTLVELASGRIDMVWTEQLPGLEARNAQELVWHAMAAQVQLVFGTQAASRPPTFVVFTTGFLDPGYRRYIIRRLREVYGFEGTPIVLNMRVREKRKR